MNTDLQVWIMIHFIWPQNVLAIGKTFKFSQAFISPESLAYIEEYLSWPFGAPNLFLLITYCLASISVYLSANKIDSQNQTNQIKLKASSAKSNTTFCYIGVSSKYVETFGDFRILYFKALKTWASVPTLPAGIFFQGKGE